MKPDTVSNVTNNVPAKSNIAGELVPLRDLVYVEPEIIKDRQTNSGLYLQGPKKQGVPNTGWVRHLGPDVTSDVKVGDHVIVNDPNMRGFHTNNVPVVPLSQEKVIGVIYD